MQRDWLADRLERSKRAIDDVSRALADAAQIDLLPQVDRLRGRLDKMIGRIRGAMQGYSGFFDLVNVNEALLDRVYEHDVAMIQKVEALAEAVEQLPDKQDEVGTLLGELFRQTDEMDSQWDVREDMLKGLE